MSSVSKNKEYTDTCGGDSGGPLTATIHQNKLPKPNFLLGTVSYGAQECAKIGSVGESYLQHMKYYQTVQI